MTVGRLNYLKKLFQYLKQNQSEDCLYLNIYSPERKTGGAIRELRLKFVLSASATIVEKNQIINITTRNEALWLKFFFSSKGSTAVRKFPVIVFIHGESYEWNSGNPYDGSVLASYGQVVLSP
jgi:neuroligin